jgi:hypothetical protein
MRTDERSFADEWMVGVGLPVKHRLLLSFFDDLMYEY